VVEPKRITDSEDLLSDLQIAGRADGQGLQTLRGCLYLEHGNIFVRLLPNDLGFPLGLVGQRHDQSRASMDHVVVGDHVPLAVIDESRSRTSWDLKHIEAEEVAT
jgi:hypothetical protein